MNNSQKMTCPKCRADITDAIPATCAAHLHPSLMAAYGSIKRQFAPRRVFNHKSIRPQEKPYYLDMSQPIGERAIFERLHDEWWQDIGKATYDACYPDR